MFDLEKAIAGWRKRMGADPALEPGYIAEIESHLRDKIDDLVSRGLGPEQAFEEAVRALGEAGVIGAQFYKVYTTGAGGRPSWQAPRFFPALAWNYVKTIARAFHRSRGFTALNIAGMALGMAAFILIMIFVRYELSYDRFHENSGRIYRVLREHQGEAVWSNSSEHPLAAALKADFPEVARATRLKKNDEVGMVERGKKRFYEEGIFFADQDFLEIFSFPLVSGDASTALKEPFSVLLTQPAAERYFGAEDPLGKILRIQEWYSKEKYDYRVRGILREIPKNSHFRFDFLVSYNTLYSLKRGGAASVESWGYYEPKTYLALRPGAEARELERKFPLFLRKYKGESAGSEKMHLQPLTAIHLGGNMKFEIEPNSDLRLIYMFSAIALFILVIAALNYTNLSVARSAKRAGEVGVRKVVGARRSQLVRQFLTESVVFAALAYGLALLVVRLVLRPFGSLVERDLRLDIVGNLGWLLAFLGLAVLVGLLSGSYPALLASSFQPLQIINRATRIGSKRSPLFRNSLVVAQFVVSIGLLVGTFVIHDQLHFIKSRDLGFGREQIVTVFTMDTKLKTNPEPFKQALLGNPDILGVTASLDLPTTIHRSTTVGWEAGGRARESEMDFTFIDQDFLDVYGIRVEKGRNFSAQFPGDKNESVIMNAAAARELGWEDPVGRMAEAAGREWKIIGVTRDFNFRSLHWKISPLVCLLTAGGRMDYFSVKVSPRNIPGTLAFMKRTWERFSPGFPFQFAFLDERIDKLYRAEDRLGRSIDIFASLALGIACLGLFGLVAFLVEEKRKEISIRRVLGADFSKVVGLLVREYAKCLAIAAAVAWPLGYWIMHRWLQNFAYRTDIRIGVFLFSGLVALVCALGTVAYQSVKAALANPVDSLRHE
jgi:putative ABC transport system permease protein